MPQPYVQAWNSDDCPRAGRYDAWDAKLNEAFGRWCVERPGSSDFSGALKTYDDNVLRIVECVCDPCSATRGTRDIISANDETLAVQVVLRGTEYVEFNGERVVLRAGDVLVWDSTRPMHFEVPERLHKISVVFPLHRFQCWYPKSWSSVRHWIDGRGGRGRLLAAHVESLSRAVFDSGCDDDYAIIDATIGVLANALDERRADDVAGLSSIQLQAAKAFINVNINDPHLSPTAIAHATRISVRYLHWLFRTADETVMQYVMKRRLHHCMIDLSNPKMNQRKLVDIACYWGFSDVAHFSKRFKQAFGLSPKAYRERANTRCPDHRQ